MRRFAWLAGFLVAAAMDPSVVCQESRPATRSESRAAWQRFQRRKEGEPQILARLNRTVCFGTCPAYTLTVFDDGRVAYVGDQFVATPGAAEARLDADQFDRLVRAFLDANFFQLEDKYDYEEVTDHPSATLTFSWERRSKSVEHYHGDRTAPVSLSRLENAVDDIVGSDRWVLTEKQRKEREQRRALRAASGQRSESRMSDSWFREHWDTTNRIHAVGRIGESAPGSARLVHLDAQSHTMAGRRLIIVRDGGYLGRVRVVSVDGANARVEVEHCEPGMTITPGDIVWDRAP